MQQRLFTPHGESSGTDAGDEQTQPRVPRPSQHIAAKQLGLQRPHRVDEASSCAAAEDMSRGVREPAASMRYGNKHTGRVGTVDAPLCRSKRCTSDAFVEALCADLGAVGGQRVVRFLRVPARARLRTTLPRPVVPAT